MKRKTGLVCAVLLAAGILAFVQPLHAAYEAVSQVVTNYCEYTGEPPLSWESHNSCFIGASCIYDLPVGDDIQTIWSDEIDDYENDGDTYTVIVDWTDDEVVGSNWAENDWFEWGEDQTSTEGTDWADVILYFGHGVAVVDGGRWHSELSMGAKQGGDFSRCWMKSYDYFNYAPYLGHMQFGISGGDANFLVLFTCHGGEYNVWLEYGWDAAMGAGQMNQILAFHGTAYTYSGIDDDFEEFMAHSCCSHIGDRWVEHASYSMYKDNPTGGDNCPVVMGWGKSHAAIEYAIYQYQAFLNFKDKTPADYSHYYFVEGCEADDVVGEDLSEESPVEDRD